MRASIRNPQSAIRNPQSSIARRRRLVRASVRTLVGLALVVAALAVFGLFYPWSSPWLDRRIRQRWLDATGVPLEYARATFRVMRGQVVIDRPVLRDPRDGATLLAVARIWIEFPFTQLLRGDPPYTIESIDVEGPVSLDLERRDGVLTPQPRIRRLAALLAERLGQNRPDTGGPPPVSLDRVAVSPIELRARDSASGSTYTLLIFDDGALDASFNRSLSPRLVMLKGTLVSHSGHRLPVQLALRSGERSAQYRVGARLTNFDSARDVPLALPLALESPQASLDGTVALRGDGAIDLDGIVTLENVALNPGDGTAPRRMGRAQLGLDCTFDPASRGVEIRNASLQGERVSFSAGGRLHLAAADPELVRDDALEFALRLTDFDSARDVAIPLPFLLRAASADLQGTLTRFSAAGFDLNGAATLSDSRLSIAGRDEPLALGDTALDLDGRLDRAAGRVEIRTAALRSDETTLTLNGSVGTAEPFDYALALDSLQVTGGALDYALRIADLGLTIDDSNSAIPNPQSAIPNRRAAELNVAARLSGSARAGPTDAFSADVRVSGVDWQPPGLGTPLRNLRLQAHVTTSSLTLDQARAEVSGLPVDLRGEVTGRLPEGRIDRVNLRWTSVGTVEDVAGLLAPPQRRQIAQWGVGGDLTGEGRIVATGPFQISNLESQISEILAKAELSGELRFRRGVLDVPFLPQRFENLRGRLVFSPTRVELNEMNGNWLNLNFGLSGAIEGTPRFWNNARGEVDLTGRFSIAEALRQLQGTIQKRGLDPSTWPALDGRVGVDLRVTARAVDWRRADWSGAIQLEDFRTTLSQPLYQGPLRLRSARLEFSPRQIALTAAEGTWGDLAIGGAGELRPGGGVIDLTAEGPLREWRERLPSELESFIVSGTARLRHRLELTSTDPLDRGADWTDWARRLAERGGGSQPPGEWLAARWAMDHAGTITLDRAEMTFDLMPSYLRGLSGEVDYVFNATRRRLWTPRPIPVEGGDGARDLMGSIALDGGDAASPPSFTFDITGGNFPIDQWVRPWLEEQGVVYPWSVDQAFDRAKPPVFLVRGTARTSSATYGSLSADHFQAAIDLDFYRGQPDLLRWHDVTMGFYGGRLSIDGEGFNYKMKSRFDVQKVSLPALVQAASGQERVHGIFSGTLDGRLDVATAHRDAPTTGVGRLEVTESRFVSNPVFTTLAKLPNFLLIGSIFNDISFSKIEGDFTMRDDTFRTDNLKLLSPFTQMAVSGTVGPEKRLDLRLQMEWLKIVDKVPLVGEAMNLFNQLLGKVIRLDIRGTVDNPVVSAL
jgi:hypothetical protein